MSKKIQYDWRWIDDVEYVDIPYIGKKWKVQMAKYYGCYYDKMMTYRRAAESIIASVCTIHGWAITVA